MTSETLFDGFDPAVVAAVRTRYAADILTAGQARAAKRHTRHEIRSATPWPL